MAPDAPNVSVLTMHRLADLRGIEGLGCVSTHSSVFHLKKTEGDKVDTH